MSERKKMKGYLVCEESRVSWDPRGWVQKPEKDRHFLTLASAERYAESINSRFAIFVPSVRWRASIEEYERDRVAADHWLENWPAYMITLTLAVTMAVAIVGG